MADPVTLAIIGIGVSVAGTAMSTMQQAKAASYSAKVYEAEAAAKKISAVYEEKKHRDQVRRFIGTQRARYGASGVDISAGGSPMAVISDTVIKGEMDAMAIRYGGDVAAIQARNQASIARFQGRQAITSGVFGAASTVLSGLDNIQQLRLKSK